VGTRRFKNLTRQITLFAVLPVIERGAATLTDPVCRMHVPPDGAAAIIIHEGVSYHFCSAECARLFSDAPGLYVAPSR
jgi:YHS domain-containing protein